MKTANSKAFSLLELLVIIAIMVLLMSIVAPTLAKIQQQARQTACGTNLHGLSQAMQLYGQNGQGLFPAICSMSENGSMYLFNPANRTAAPSTTGIPSPTVDLWAIVRRAYTVPKQFLCPATKDEGDPAQDPLAYYDFQELTNLSYGYQYQHDPDVGILGPDSDPMSPLMADGNPYIKGGISPTDFADDRMSRFRGNSRNHPNTAGQNVLYVSGHVVFERGPDIGLSGNVATGLTISRGRDHCYTMHSSTPGAQVDYGIAAPTWTQPTSSGYCDLGSKSDACLVP